MVPSLKTLLHHPDPIDPVLWSWIKDLFDKLPLPPALVIVVFIILIILVFWVMLVFFAHRSRR